MCVRCFGEGHGFKNCEFKLKGVCHVCLLPGRFKGNHLHDDGTYGRCQYKVADSLGPLAWLVWNDFVSGKVPKMEDIIRNTDLKVIGLLTKIQYHDWLNKVGDRGLPNIFKLVELAVTHGWVKY